MNPLFLQIQAGGEAVLTEEPTEKTMSILELMTSGGIGGNLDHGVLGNPEYHGSVYLSWNALVPFAMRIR
jgi:hypothetical protein